MRLSIEALVAEFCDGSFALLELEPHPAQDGGRFRELDLPR